MNSGIRREGLMAMPFLWGKELVHSRKFLPKIKMPKQNSGFFFSLFIFIFFLMRKQQPSLCKNEESYFHRTLLKA